MPSVVANNPQFINPNTQQPYTDAEALYVNTVASQQAAGTYNAARDAQYLASAPGQLVGENGMPGYTVAGGETLIMDKAARDYQAAQIADAQAQNETNRMNISQTAQTAANDLALKEQQREDTIRSNPLNAALYEQERRGWRAGPTGNENPLDYAAGKTAGMPATTPTIPSTVAPAVTPGTVSAQPVGTPAPVPGTGAAAAPGAVGTAPKPVASGGGGGGDGLNFSQADINLINSRVAGHVEGGDITLAGYKNGAPGGAPGGAVTVGGQPHWIVDSMGNPVAALSEDGQKETVKGKGGVEVIPQNPARKAAYTASKSRPGAQSGNSAATLSGRTTQSKQVNARTSAAPAGDGRANNGKTNNGRPPAPGSEVMKPGVADKDAASVRPAVTRGPLPVQTPMVQGPMGVGAATVPVRQPSGAVMPYRPGAVDGGLVPVPQVAGHAMGTLPSDAYGGLGGASNAFVASGKGTAQDFENLMLGRGATAPSNSAQTQTQSTNTVSAQPVAAPTPVAPAAAPAPTAGAPDPFSIPGAPAMNASGGSRTIGNATAPMSRFGFDKNAPIDIAAHGATRGIPGMPGVRIDQPWKIAPRTVLQNGAFGNQLLQSYWNASGGAPEDLAGRTSAPGQAGSTQRFV
jgi:hypothetical protein